MKKQTIKTGRKIVSLFLIAAMLFTTQGIPVLADMVKESGYVAEGKVLPSNPVHNCTKKNDGTDTTDWSYVYFGSYPQSEVVGDDLNTIVGASYDAKGDAWVNGVKYRRISKSDTYQDSYFGDKKYRYFKWEQIKWRVLQNDGNTLFVIADKALDCEYYKRKTVDNLSTTWSDCTLKQWLNGTFYKTAFSSKEQGAIVSQTVVNENNPDYETSGGYDTNDKIYLLSINEAKNSKYGFCEKGDVFSKSRMMRKSDYAYVRGVSGASKYCSWWLRSSGYNNHYAANVENSGDISSFGHDISAYPSACVPVLHINLSSNLWSVADDGIGKSELDPVHNCTNQNDGTDTTNWSYVYFGSYPQSEVTGNALNEAIVGASYDADGDAWVNGTKYRRISKSDTNNKGYFGNNTYRYFKWERIKWRVLQNNGRTLFVIADTGLDCKNYNNSGGVITWENCTLRNWLNNEFYGTAFSNEEQGAIVSQTVISEDNPYNYVYGESGNEIIDKVFLLSLSKVGNTDYGFCENESTYSISRRVKTSDYAHVRGATVSNSCSDWWLRSPGECDDRVAYVTRNGRVYSKGSVANDNDKACVPVLRIDQSSDFWFKIDDGTSGAGGESAIKSPLNPVHNCTKQNDGTDTTNWSYVYFGSYPQSEVIGNALNEAIVGASYDADGDAWVNGTKYRRISKSDTNNNEYFGNNTYRYFKWERIKWRVLQNNGRTLFVLADTGLDCKDYHDSGGAITWENCTLRDWLNNNFYGTAFSNEEQGAIVSQTVISEDNPYYYVEGGNDTIDKVFLLSLSEVRNPGYGFCENGSTYSISRRVKTSDYAHVRGATVSNSCSNWWLRTPGRDSKYAATSMNEGASGTGGKNVDFDKYMCVPTLHINFSSNHWSMTDDGTSGAGGDDQKPDSGKELAEIKNRLKEELESYKNASDYREAQQKELSEAIVAGKAAIEAAEDEAGVKQALAEAKAVIEQIKTDAQLTEEEKEASLAALKAAKEQRKQELESYKNASDYREAQQKELSEAIVAGKAAIEAAEDEAGVKQALAEAKTEIDKIKTDAQLTEEENQVNPDPEKEPANPVHNCTKQNDGTDTTDWSYVYFGSYPQSEVTGNALNEAIVGASYDADGDAWVNGTKYRRISKSDTNYSGYFGDSTYRYFKWERIKWRVLQNNDRILFVIADTGLDCKDYHDSGGAITWENCTLRNWLNNDFYRMAFNNKEQGTIVSQTVVNEDNPWYSGKGGNVTTDEVCLLSLSEIRNPDYGFCESEYIYSVSRKVKVSDYAHVKGAVRGELTINNGNTSSSADCWWWLRSPGYNSKYAAYVSNMGDVGKYGCEVDFDKRACVPTLHINFSSNHWSMTDDGISGSGGEDQKPDSKKELAEIKNRLKEELESYKSASDYREAQQKELAEAVAAGKIAIEAAEDEEGVNRALAAAKAVIDQIKTNAQLTEEEKEASAESVKAAKERSKQELESYKNTSDYREAQQKELTEAVAAGKIAIEAAEDEAGVNRALAAAKTVIDQIKTDAQLTEEEKEASSETLKAAKEQRKQELESYKNTSDYREAQQKELTEAVAAGKIAIEAAEDEAGVNQALAAAKAVIDQIKTNAQLTEEENQVNPDPEKEPANPAHYCTKQNDGSDTTEWSYVYFGSYPQSEVTGNKLSSAIIGASYDTKGDAWVNGTKYRRISNKDTNYNGNFGDSTYRYFKWERIKWRVLEVNSETMFVMADKGLDCKDYHDPGGPASITWEDCTLRNWLNNDFYGAAFSGSEQEAIVSQMVVNEDNLYTAELSIEGGNDTLDKVFLLSLSEVKNQNYGFCESYNTFSASRIVKASDYAYARGTSLSDRNTGDKDNCWWWLRSPGMHTTWAACVFPYGYVNSGGVDIICNYACVPALHINLSSNLWFMTDDGTSGAGGENSELDLKKVLTEIKNSFKEELESYKNASDYREAQQKELAEAIAAGKTAIEAAEDEAGANQALAAAKAVIDQIKTDAQLTEEEKEASSESLKAAKEQRKQELESYKNASDYREAQQKELSEAIVAGKAAIEAAEDEAGVKQALAEAKAVIEQIKTDAQLTEEEKEASSAALKVAKEQRKQELETYKNASDYREAQQKELAETVSAGKAAIEAAEDETGVNRALVAAKVAIDQIKTDAQLTEEEKESLATELADKLEEYKELYEGNGSAYTVTTWKRFKEACEAVQAALIAENKEKEDLEDLLEELNAARAGLRTEMPAPAVDPELETLIADLKEKLDEYKDCYEGSGEGYTTATWTLFKEAYAAAQDALAGNKDDKDVLEKFLQGLKDAYAALAEKGPVIPSDPEVEILRRDIKEKLDEYKPVFSGNGEKYTSETWEHFKTAYLAAQSAYENGEQDKDTLDALLKELNEAKGALKDESIPPTSVEKDLDAAKESLSTILSNYQELYTKGEEKYTEDSWKEFAAAYSNAQDALAEGSENIETLRLLKDHLENAYSRLIEKPADKQVLAAPTIASVSFMAEKKKLGVKITVQKVANAVSYTVYRIVGGSVTEIGTTDTSGVIYDENPVSKKLMSYYAVANPSSESGQESDQGPVKSITLESSVKKVKAKQAKRKMQVNISWKRVKNAKQYLIYRSTKKDSGYVKIKSLKNKKLSYTDKKVKKGRTYYYRIVVKTKKGYSGISTSKAVKIKK